MLNRALLFIVCVALSGVAVAQSNLRLGLQAPAASVYQSHFNQGPQFEVHSPLRLESVLVWSDSAGQVAVRLLDGAGQVRETVLVPVAAAGGHRLELNFHLEPGIWRLDAVGTTGTTVAYESQVVTSPQGNRDLSIDPNPVGSGANFGPFFDWQVTTIASERPEEFGHGARGSSTVLPRGWRNGGGAGRWWLDADGTPSPNTGPATGASGEAHSNYIFFESSRTQSGDQAILLAPPVLLGSAPQLHAEFAFHMHGAGMGSLEAQVWDGAAWQTAFSMVGDQGDAWHRAGMTLIGVHGQASFRFVATDGIGNTSDIAIDDVVVGAAAAGVPFGTYQTNSAPASLTLDGLQGSAHRLAVKHVETLSYLELDSNMPGQPFDVFFSASPVLAGPRAGALTTGAGQIFGINLAAPLTTLNNPTFGQGLNHANPSPFPGTFRLPLWATTTPVRISGQMAVIDPTQADGVRLSQPSEAWLGAANLAAGDASVPALATPLTLSRDGSVRVNLGVPFAFQGRQHSELWVTANGVIAFDGPSASAIADEQDFRAGLPRIATLATDLDPSAGGTVWLWRGTDGSLEVGFDAVPSMGGAGLNTFRTRLDPAGRIEMHFGAVAASSAIVGLTPGGWLANPVTENLSAASGLSIAPGADLFERFGTGTVPFDLSGKRLVWHLDAAGIPTSID